MQEDLALGNIKVHQEDDSYNKSMRAYLEWGELPSEDDTAREVALTSHEYMIRHEVVYRWRKERGKIGEIHFCIVVPPTLVPAAIKAVHDAPSLCHPGVTRTLDVAQIDSGCRKLCCFLSHL